MQIESQSASSTLDEIKASYSLADIMTAKVVVKRLVQSGMRKGPSDLLVLPDSAIELWYNDEAVRYLEEQRVARSKPMAVIP